MQNEMFVLEERLNILEESRRGNMGTPGHMAHPFDVDDIETGEDLVDYINNAVSQLAAGEIAGSVKWDGINTSFKLVTDQDGKKDFRMDRGCQSH